MSANFWGDIPEEEYYTSQGVKNTKGSFQTKNGKIFTQSWLPLNETPNGVVCFTHGYTSDTGWTFQLVTIAAAQWGYAAFGADLLAHGRSDGLAGHVENLDKTAESALAFYQSVRDTEEYKGLPAFLFGESLGGMITLLMHFADPNGWDGLILSAPLIVLPARMRINRLQNSMFRLARPLIGTWSIFPSHMSKPFRDPTKGKLIASNPRRFAGKPPVQTMLEVSRVAEILERDLDKVTAPFLALHGDEDAMSELEGSKNLLEKARSKDKTLKIYSGAYHSLIQGELDETRQVVLADIKQWLDEHVDRKLAAVLESSLGDTTVQD